MRRIVEAIVALVAWMAVVALGAALASGALAAATSPAVVTRAASAVGQTSAVLNGTVNPNGSGTTYFFQWGLTNSYGVNGNALSAGSGKKSVAVHETASGLVPATVYHYRLVASNRFGTTVGADHTFKTTGHPPPGVTTGPATGISSSGATLTGVVNPNGQQTSWTFQFGATTAYGALTSGGTVAASSAPTSVASAMPPLKPGTVYHYRLVATHGTGNTTTAGADGTFMTYPRRRPAPHVRAGTRPLRLRHKPYRVGTLGVIGHPAWIPAQFACTGNVEIRFSRRHRRVATLFVPLQPNCTFGGTITFAHRHRPLTVRVHFDGNHYLAPAQGGRARLTFT